jgi:hypothetical protein
MSFARFGSVCTVNRDQDVTAIVGIEADNTSVLRDDPARYAAILSGRRCRMDGPLASSQAETFVLIR